MSKADTKGKAPAEGRPELSKSAVEEETVGGTELADADLDSAAGGVRIAAMSAGANTKTSAAPICHGSICCEILTVAAPSGGTEGSSGGGSFSL